MSAQRQKPIDFAAEGLRLALFVDRNCGIRVKAKPALKLGSKELACRRAFLRSESDTANHKGARTDRLAQAVPHAGEIRRDKRKNAEDEETAVAVNEKLDAVVMAKNLCFLLAEAF